MWRNTPSPDSSRDSRGSTPTSVQYDEYRGKLQIGDRVIISGNRGDAKTGILRYIGPLEFAKGNWAGVELFYPQGKNNGTVEGMEYFRCQNKFGTFVPLRKVSRSPVNKIIANQIGVDHNHKCPGPGKCSLHDKIYWNTMAVLGTGNN